MGIFDALLSRPDPDADEASPAHSAERSSSSTHDGRASLERRRDELVAQVAELHWDLGGLAYEMAIRDHFRLDVLVRRAAELQERDAELGELERVLSLQENAGAGSCPGCGAVHGRGALYCWQCGKVLMERVPSAAANGSASALGEAAKAHGEPASKPGEASEPGETTGGLGEATGTPAGGGRLDAQTVASLPPHPPSG
jgi:hypothetical protein